MSLPPNHVSKTTWLDLLDCTYDAFIEELSYLHATLQKQASGNTTDGLFCFVGQVWWYHIDRTGSTTTVGESDMSDVWVCLENFEVYDEMIDIFCNDYHDENVALIITNNLELIANHGFLPPSSYPRYTPPQSGRLCPPEASVAIFPVLFTIRQAPYVHLPAMLSWQRKPLKLHPRSVFFRIPVQRRKPSMLQPQNTQSTHNSSTHAGQPSTRAKQAEPSFLISRRASDIRRRYSLPFDRSVIGLEDPKEMNDKTHEIYHRRNRFLRPSAIGTFKCKREKFVKARAG